ncbi:mucin-binding protein [Limosilactobacillus reuteri]|uniref:mucin-binding protein n=1 Tax=Limosilactobacillus reuteri TaxID=1598 RepID=UPI001E48C525|nr:Ig-like domain-containing protein [Limosilactobacillus reuteri]MCC4489895.1 Ig-like domain-containing protein [Limosilactobacillus reuteri]MCC4494058.1 Ig-like domain-containing protein [Limosilactobacillus reuteri]MCC4496549.1 Ig-like domain-containing protein [Limosilactobacillus reuteri]
MEQKDRFIVNRQRQRFSIRKVAGKTASVMIGTTLLGVVLGLSETKPVNAQAAEVDETTETTASSLTNQNQVTLQKPTVTSAAGSAQPASSAGSNEKQALTVTKDLATNAVPASALKASFVESPASSATANPTSATSGDATPTQAKDITNQLSNVTAGFTSDNKGEEPLADGTKLDPLGENNVIYGKYHLVLPADAKAGDTFSITWSNNLNLYGSDDPSITRTVVARDENGQEVAKGASTNSNQMSFVVEPNASGSINAIIPFFINRQVVPNNGTITVSTGIGQTTSQATVDVEYSNTDFSNHGGPYPGYANGNFTYLDRNPNTGAVTGVMYVNRAQKPVYDETATLQNMGKDNWTNKGYPNATSDISFKAADADVTVYQLKAGEQLPDSFDLQTIQEVGTDVTVDSQIKYGDDDNNILKVTLPSTGDEPNTNTYAIVVKTKYDTNQDLGFLSTVHAFGQPADQRSADVPGVGVTWPKYMFLINGSAGGNTDEALGQVIVTVHDDTTGQDLVDNSKYVYNSGQKQVKTSTGYNQADVEKTLTDHGYKVVRLVDTSKSNNPVEVTTVPTEIPSNVHSYVIHVVHDVVPVNNTTDPHKPNTPINPNDPNSKDWPAADQYTKSYTYTVKYQDEQGNELHAASSPQTSTWNRTVYVDKVTGQVDDTKSTPWKPDKTNFDQVDVPSITNYHVKGTTTQNGTAIADGNVASIPTKQDNIVDVVVYAKNGKIVPVDPNRNKIPNAPTPTYETDPNDPTKVVPNEPVPTIPGYTPNMETVTPKDPGEDTEVTYTKTPADQMHLTVKYIDLDNNNAEIATEGQPSGKSGDKINYATQTTITNLENKGYVLVDDGFTGKAGDKFSTDNNDKIYLVTFHHGTATSTPNKPATPGTPINPNDPAGPKWPAGSDEVTEDATQTVRYHGAGDKTPKDHVATEKNAFTRTITVDKVTGEVTKTGDWTPATHNFDGVKTPKVDGYKADKETATTDAATPANPNVVADVYYTNVTTSTPTPENGTVTRYITYTGITEKDKVPASPKDDTVKTTTTNGKTTPDGNFPAVKNPVVPGYHTEKPSVPVSTPGKNGVPTSGTYNVEVPYTKNGKIVPVDPDGHKIPNAPTPTYTTNPNDPTKVVPNEPVPTIPGYTPKVTSVTPKNPGKDTKVVYTKNTPSNPIPNLNIQLFVRYVDLDNNDSEIVPEVTQRGADGSKINYTTGTTISDLEKQGYVLVTDGFTGHSGSDFNLSNDGKTYVVTFKHGTVTSTPDQPGQPNTPINNDDPQGPQWPADSNVVTMTATQTVHYRGAGDKTPADHVTTVDHAFTRTITVDKVTGKVISTGAWTPANYNFAGVPTPVIAGYHADVSVATTTAATPENPNVETVVTYVPNGKIVPVDPAGNRLPNVPTPTYQTDPNDPTKVVPNEPVPTIPGYTPRVTTVTPAHPSVNTPVVYTQVTTTTPTTPTSGNPTPADNPTMPSTPVAPAETPTATPVAKAPAATPAAQTPQRTLPQTGATDSSVWTKVGAELLVVASALGLTGYRKRRHEDK